MDFPTIRQEQVLASAAQMPSFPSVINEILGTLNDPDANLQVLAGYIKHDPVITARVLASANKAASHSRGGANVKDIFTATSLIGIGRIRQMALMGSLESFVRRADGSMEGLQLWRHAVGVGICAEEIMHQSVLNMPPESALIAGLVHDLGELWLVANCHEVAVTLRREAHARHVATERVEQERLGADHAEIGAWLAEHWLLPAPIVAAVRGHHAPDQAANDTLASVIHVAEVVANALDLARSECSRVTDLSATACARIGIAWDAKVQPMFGRIDARTRHAFSQFEGVGA